MREQLSQSFWSELAAEEICSSEPLEGGKNGRVHLLRAVSGREFVGKQFFSHPNDPRQRLATEVSAIGLLRQGGFADVAQILNHDEREQVLLYKRLQGEKITGARRGDVDGIIHFIRRLQELSLSVGTPHGGGWSAPASEACFSSREIAQNLKERRDRLLCCPGNGQIGKAMEAFLQQEFVPLFNWARTNCSTIMADNGMGQQGLLAPQFRLLSPSDLGFHNCLRRGEGELSFFDFEYFGWDDPAKTYCDFLLHPHPSMAMEHSLAVRFSERFLALFPDPELKLRIRAYFPLFACKWILILLNEFTGVDGRRRRFSIREEDDGGQHLQIQLDQARSMGQNLRRKYERICRYLA